MKFYGISIFNSNHQQVFITNSPMLKETKVENYLSFSYSRIKHSICKKSHFEGYLNLEDDFQCYFRKIDKYQILFLTSQSEDCMALYFHKNDLHLFSKALSEIMRLDPQLNLKTELHLILTSLMNGSFLFNTTGKPNFLKDVITQSKNLENKLRVDMDFIVKVFSVIEKEDVWSTYFVHNKKSENIQINVNSFLTSDSNDEKMQITKKDYFHGIPINDDFTSAPKILLDPYITKKKELYKSLAQNTNLLRKGDMSFNNRRVNYLTNYKNQHNVAGKLRQEDLDLTGNTNNYKQNQDKYSIPVNHAKPQEKESKGKTSFFRKLGSYIGFSKEVKPDQSFLDKPIEQLENNEDRIPEEADLLDMDFTMDHSNHFGGTNNQGVRADHSQSKINIAPLTLDLTGNLDNIYEESKQQSNNPFLDQFKFAVPELPEDPFSNQNEFNQNESQGENPFLSNIDFTNNEQLTENPFLHQVNFSDQKNQDNNSFAGQIDFNTPIDPSENVFMNQSEFNQTEQNDTGSFLNNIDFSNPNNETDSNQWDFNKPINSSEMNNYDFNKPLNPSELNNYGFNKAMDSNELNDYDFNKPMGSSELSSFDFNKPMNPSELNDYDFNKPMGSSELSSFDFNKPLNPSELSSFDFNKPIDPSEACNQDFNKPANFPDQNPFSLDTNSFNTTTPDEGTKIKSEPQPNEQTFNNNPSSNQKNLETPTKNTDVQDFNNPNKSIPNIKTNNVNKNTNPFEDSPPPKATSNKNTSKPSNPFLTEESSFETKPNITEEININEQQPQKDISSYNPFATDELEETEPQYQFEEKLMIQQIFNDIKERNLFGQLILQHNNENKNNSKIDLKSQKWDSLTIRRISKQSKNLVTENDRELQIILPENQEISNLSILDYIYKENFQSNTTLPFMIKFNYSNERKILIIHVFCNSIYDDEFRKNTSVTLFFNKHINKAKLKTIPQAEYYENFEVAHKNFVKWDIELVEPGKFYEFEANLIEYGLEFKGACLQSIYNGLYQDELGDIGIEQKLIDQVLKIKYDVKLE